MKKHKEIEDINLSISILDEHHKKFLNKFQTGNNYPEKGLGDYIRDDAFDEMLSGDGVSYLVLKLNEEKEPEELVAYFTLVSSAIPCLYRTEEDDGEAYEVMCGIPAIRIHMFAVSDKYQDVFYKDKPIAAWIFETIISIIDEKAKRDTGIKAIYLHALPSSKNFYKKNKMLEAEKYMKPFSGMDDDLDVMYVFIRDVNITYEDTRKKRLPFFVRLKKRIGRWLLK